MPDFMEIVQQRRSVRKYEDKEISEDVLNRILDAVRFSPSWANTQCWEIVHIKDTGLRERLQGTLPPNNPAFKSMLKAPALLAMCAKQKVSGFYKGRAETKFGDWFMFDLGLATQTLCLTAQSLGVGTVIVGMLDHDKAAEIINLPPEYEVAALIPLGYPLKISKAPRRKELNEFLHMDTF